MSKREIINVADEHKRVLAEDFEVTLQTVRMALMYVNNSNKGKAIRKRAKELLKKEADNINED